MLIVYEHVEETRRLLRPNGQPARADRGPHAGREVLVSQSVADASDDDGIAFQDIGLVELKGVSGTTHLLRAHAN
jgi:class 3 adenylate cyclase